LDRAIQNPMRGRDIKIDEGRSIDVFINNKFGVFDRFGHRLTFPSVWGINVRLTQTPHASNGRALGMNRHLAVVRWSETSGGGKRLFNSIFMSAMLRVG
jgi:hypothetical protein